MQIIRKALKYPITISGNFAELGIVSVFSAMSVFMIAITRIPNLKFSWNLIFDYFLEICDESQVHLKSDQYAWYFIKKHTCFYLNIPSVLLEIINVSRKFV